MGGLVPIDGGPLIPAMAGVDELPALPWLVARWECGAGSCEDPPLWLGDAFA